MLPKGLTNEELAYWSRMESIASGLLDELKQEGWLKTERQFDQETFGQLLKIGERVNEHFITWNMLQQIFPPLRQFLIGQGVGFTDDNVDNVWFYYLSSVFLETTEFPLKHLLSALRWKSPFRGNMTLGEFIKALKTKCPKFGPELAAEVDVPLRNAIAHGLYWMSKQTPNGPLYLNYCEVLGEVPTSEPLLSVALRMRKHNIVGSSVADVLGKKATSGFFK